MAPYIHSYQTPTTGNFTRIKIGDAVGSVDGPGVSPIENNLGVVLGFGEDSFYKYVVVQRADGSRNKIVSFTEVGIGHYHLPTYMLNQQAKM